MRPVVKLLHALCRVLSSCYKEQLGPDEPIVYACTCLGHAGRVKGPRIQKDRSLMLARYSDFGQMRCTVEFVHYFVPGSGAKYCDERVCLSVCPLACLKKRHVKISRNFLYMLLVAVAWSFSDDSLICYILPHTSKIVKLFPVCILPVLWMTSRLTIIGQAKSTPTGRLLKVTHQGAAPGSQSDVHGCLLHSCRNSFSYRIYLIRNYIYYFNST